MFSSLIEGTIESKQMENIKVWREFLIRAIKASPKGTPRQSMAVTFPPADSSVPDSITGPTNDLEDRFDRAVNYLKEAKDLALGTEQQLSFYSLFKAHF